MSPCPVGRLLLFKVFSIILHLQRRKDLNKQLNNNKKRRKTQKQKLTFASSSGNGMKARVKLTTLGCTILSIHKLCTFQLQFDVTKSNEQQLNTVQIGRSNFIIYVRNCVHVIVKGCGENISKSCSEMTEKPRGLKLCPVYYYSLSVYIMVQLVRIG